MFRLLDHREWNERGLKLSNTDLARRAVGGFFLKHPLELGFFDAADLASQRCLDRGLARRVFHRGRCWAPRRLPHESRARPGQQARGKGKREGQEGEKNW